MASETHISAKNGREFYFHLAAYAFGQFLEHSDGCVLIQEPGFKRHADGGVEATVRYLPVESDCPEMPAQALSMAKSYDPEREAIVVIAGRQGGTVCLKLTARQIGCGPQTAYMKTKGWYVAIDPGAVLLLKEQAGGAGPGHYVFLREELTQMVLARAGLDEAADRIVPSEETVRVHIDFVELFKPTGMNVYHPAE